MTKVAPQRAATVLVLRAFHDEIQVLLVRRGARASFMANAYVFPGGRVDTEDALFAEADATRRCAARELHEEAGLVVANLQELVYFARFVTPTAEPRRFDADFFLWALPTNQSPKVDAQEVFDLRWYTPEAALAEYANGQLHLPPPTVCALEDLQAEVQRLCEDGVAKESLLNALLKACAQRRPYTILPRLGATADGSLEILLPWDEEYASLNSDDASAPTLGLAEGAAPVSHRICRTTLSAQGIWKFRRC